MNRFLRTLLSRRKDPRIPLDTDIRVRMAGQEIAAGRCSNICMGGMCIVFNSPPAPVGTGTVWLSRDYSDTYIKIEASFRVAWRKPENPGSLSTILGIVFIDLVPEQRDRLYTIISRESRAHNK